MKESTPYPLPPMKASQLVATSAAVIGVYALLSERSLANNSASTIPAVPVGVMTAAPTVIQTGMKPTLSWNILYPSKVSDMVLVRPPGTLIPNQTVYATVQIVGTGVTTCSPGQSPTSTFSDARVSYNGGSYQQLFYGTQTLADPSKKLYIKKVDANQTIDFGGRYVQNNGVWSPFYTTKSANLQVVALVNGDIPPTRYPLHQSTSLASYLGPYLDASGKVNIGPLSVLVLMELGQTDRSQSCFDYQDQVLLVTFSSKHPNNGHGNNLDGVDSSNPGQGKGGPNGAVDPSGGVDDER